ncbi:MAG: HAD family hydrolase [Candidatus Latescibacterota bacterium]|nr:HAD family hydrolase [Candidatus Latescibacterota bacterium]
MAESLEAVIFDLDGTLLDTLEDLADSMNAVLSARGYPPHPVEAYRFFVGEGVEMLVRRALLEAEGDRDDEVARCVERMRSEYSSRWADKTRPYDGIDDLLHDLADAGIPKAVLSNKPEDFTLLTVGRLLRGHVFVSVRGQREDTPAKPDPAGALAIAEELGLEPAQVLYVGDTATDMQTASRAGMYAVGVSWGFRSVQELVDHGACMIVDRPAQLMNFFTHG